MPPSVRGGVNPPLDKREQNSRFGERATSRLPDATAATLKVKPNSVLPG
jgi:hypothetical protein